MKALVLSAAGVLAALLSTHLASAPMADVLNGDQPGEQATAEPQGSASSVVELRTRVYVNIPHQDLDAYVRYASEIVRASVGWRRELASPEGQVTTEYGICVTESYKGHLSGPLSVRVAGGAFGPYETIVDRAPQLPLGGEMVLFLCRGTDPSTRGILGLDDGAYYLSIADDGQSVVTGLNAHHEPLSAFTARLSGLMAPEQK